MSTASDLLAKYLAAESAILSGQEFRMGDRALKMADLAEVRAERQRLELRVNAETRGGSPRYQTADFS
jgi:hypothetical protein